MASKEILELKQQQVEEIKSKISTAKGLVIIDYMGLNVAQDTAFRKEMRTAGVDYQVLKNRLVNHCTLMDCAKSPAKIAPFFEIEKLSMEIILKSYVADSTAKETATAIQTKKTHRPKDRCVQITF